MRKLLFAMTMGALLLLGAQRGDQADRQLQSAINKEIVEGDLRGAIEQYKKIAQGGNRAVAAKALVRMGQCYEKLGDVEARKAYERVLRDYTDQPEPARLARERLAALGGANGRSSSGVVVRRVGSGAYSDTLWARVSLNGRYLSFSDPETFDLAVRDLLTGKSWRLTNRGRQANQEHPVFGLVSPDGSQVAYVCANLKAVSQEAEFHLVGLDGSGDRILGINSYREAMLPQDWSPDSRHILVIRGRSDGTYQLALISVAEGSVRALKTFDWRYPHSPRFSPDGRYIAYGFPPKEDSPDRHVFVLAVDGSRETALIEHPVHDYALEWSPDGSRVLFVSDRTGTFSLWSIPVRDGKPQGSPELVKQDIGRVTSMGFTSKGSLYFYNRTPSGMSDVYVAKLDPETGRLLASPKPAPQRFSGSSDWPAWSPDGRYLAYIARRGPVQLPYWRNVGDDQVIVIRSVETGQERELSPKLTRYWQLRWTRDGRALVTRGAPRFAGGKGRESLQRIDAQTGEVTTMVLYEPGQRPGRNFDWSRDGKAFFHSYGDLEAREDRLVRRDLATGQEAALYRRPYPPESLLGFALSPDGRNIALGVLEPATGSHFVNVMLAAGGEPRELVRFQDRQSEARFHRYDWTPDGRYLIYAKNNPQDEKAEFWRIAIEGGKPQKLDLVVEGLRTLQMHPDGQRIVFSAGKTSEERELWVIENFLPKLSAAR